MTRKQQSPARERHTEAGAAADRLSVAIVGAGLGGLACACAMQQRAPSAVVTVYEQQQSIEAGYDGEIELRRAGPQVITSICGPHAWMNLRAKSHSPRPYSVPIQSIRQMLARRLRRGTARFGLEVARVVRQRRAESPRGVSFLLIDSNCRELGAFDYVIDASGLGGGRMLDQLRPGGSTVQGDGWQDATVDAAIGDAGTARRGAGMLGSILDGVRRNRHGGDDALREGAALGKLLAEHSTPLLLLGVAGADGNGRLVLSGAPPTQCSSSLQQGSGGLRALKIAKRRPLAEPTDPHAALRWLLHTSCAVVAGVTAYRLYIMADPMIQV